MTILLARRSFQSSLPDFDAIVYVADTFDSESTETSKVELESLLVTEIISRPILVLFSVSDPSNEEQIIQELGLAEKVGAKVKVYCFVYFLGLMMSLFGLGK